ncbi:PhzF family phenazine biosynthesis protein [Anaerosalibacter sp. Marseille-P3206]|uniref:PhzF family phenazine biosynthesis protein n=1 Tax=Anaerosalibacter sp. Marseille-P3206 TaxID=1871005 RepID=UPI0009867517|nr:PhzF family phenazine biosynthesis protein [Anaerosalibacter sp. Marseille-P3206]
MQLNIYQVDAFTDVAFGGNPAGVVPDASELSEADMRRVAREMNLAETAFIFPKDKSSFRVRFFTPVCEIDLCGHATIGSFYSLAKKGYITPIDDGIKRIYQETRVGNLLVEIYYKDGEVYKVMMEQGRPKSIGDVSQVDRLLKAMRIDANDVGTSFKEAKPEIISTGLPDIMLPIKDKETLYNIKANYEELEELSHELGILGVHAFSLSDSKSDIVYTRNFAPLVGINEESATGTANGAMLYYLKKNDLLENNEIISVQGETMNRTSHIHCQIEKDGDSFMVKVGGQSIIVIEGIINI